METCNFTQKLVHYGFELFSVQYGYLHIKKWSAFVTSVFLCLTSVLLWRIIHTVPCVLREEISVFWSREKVELERLKPPRKFFSITHTYVPPATTRTLLERDCYSPTLFWRYPHTHTLKNTEYTLWWFSLSFCNRLLGMPKLFGMTIQVALGNTWTFSLTIR